MILTHHYSDEVSIVIAERTVPFQDEMLRPQEDVEVSRVVAHHLGDLIDPVVLQKRIDE
ncbi:unnamed protein product [Nesidiocoris tenuis]|uniref:Uncharacterized protein n=1 Tax=Nesidiocoris tenuis TaxID=355587 RepID=A0A6H5HIS6_9HEMI|nr:unnamed protein product [Nesidiocoris tenuis]